MNKLHVPSPAPAHGAPDALTDVAHRLARLPGAQRDQFRRMLAARGIPLTNLPTVRQSEESRRTPPLSPAQERLWFLDQIDGPGAAYNICTALRMDGPLDAAALRRSFELLLARHAGLCTSLTTHEGRATQRFVDGVALPWREVSLAHLSPAEQANRLEAIGHEMAAVRFDLTRPPLLTLLLARTGAQAHVLWFTLHHIVVDGWSLDLLLGEAAALYAELSGGPEARLAPLDIDPIDCALWQRELLQSDTSDRALTYWKTVLGDEHPPLMLPTDRPRPPRQSHRGATHGFGIPDGLAERLRTLARSKGKTLFTLLMAAMHALLYRYTGQRDIRIGTPVANRDRVETHGVVGLFLNTLVVKSEPTGALRFDELLALVGRRLIDAQSRHPLPFERLVDALQPARDLSHSPLFQAMLIVHAPQESVEWRNLDVRPFGTPTTTAKFDLTLEFADEGDALRAGFNYATDLFDASTIERLARHFLTLLQGVVEAPDMRLDALPLLTRAEREQVMRAWNDTATAYPQRGWVHEHIEQQALETPDAPAVLFRDEVLSYAQLDRRANQLAHRLRESGVGPDGVVGVCCVRSIDMVVSLLAILKAGGAYLPLDPDYPSDRLQQMLDDAGARWLITHHAAPWRPAHRDALCLLVLDELAADLARRPSHGSPAALRSDHLAYVIYTSGSTGRPKGVAVPHGGLLNRLQWMQATYRLGPDDRVLQKTPFSFDVSVWEFFWPLMSGATLVVAEPGDHRDSERLAALIRARRVTTLHFVPSMLRAFLDDPNASRCHSLKRVICSGEALPPDLQDRFFSLLPAELHNLYGPTEASIDVSHWACRRDAGDAQVPIGRPIANTRLHVMDDALNLVPAGVAGELFIGGIGLARGYLGRPDLTAERFIPDPHANGERLYRTGDLARGRADGAIDYLGRLDHQVKVRGFRIELGEIEARLLSHPAVAHAVVVAREDRPGDKRLVAYWVADGAAPDEDTLVAFLREALPEHMVPAAWVRLDAMPLSTNGKLDRKALPAPRVLVSTGDNAAPRNATEQILTEAWCDVLALPSVGVHDNFFRLGGDSILSLQVIARARQRGLKLAPRQMFEHQTVASLAAAATVIDSTLANAPADEALAGDVPLTPIQHWFFDARFRTPSHWNQAVLLTLREADDAAMLPAAFQAVVERHACLRLRFSPSEDGGWQQRYAADMAVHVEQVDLSSVAPGARREAIERHGDALQARFHLSDGPLWGATLFTSGGEEPPRLLIAVHHLAVDGVSWRILLDDLQGACKALRAGRPPTLPPVPTSYRQWAQRLQAHARADETRSELAHWLQTHEGVVPALRAPERGPLGRAVRLRVQLDPGRTAALLGPVPARQRARVDDLLLTALTQALCDGRDAAVLVELEGHGREDIFPDLDTSRTVGWFTTRYPVRLAPGADGPLGALKAVKEQLRQVPRRGIGHGLLRHLGTDADRAQLGRLPSPDVCFNYLGRFDRVFHRDAAFALDDGSPGATRDADERRTHALDVDAQVNDDVLTVDWTSGGDPRAVDETHRLAHAFIGHLEAIVDALANAPAGATPSDFPLCAIAQGELDAMTLPWDRVEDIYPLAPMQHGLLLHTLLNPGSGMYLMQDRYRLEGDVDPEAFVGAWERVVERHPVLRTSFHWEREDRPLQVVHRQVPSPVTREDWQGLAPEAQRQRLDALLARELSEGFDLSEPRLIRFRLIDLGQGRWYFTQSYHHILIDAWCFSLLMVDFFAHYRALRDGEAEPPLPLPRPYADFIRWLGQQDLQSARRYWTENLAGFTQPTSLGIDKLPDHRMNIGVEDHALQLDEAETASLHAMAQKLQITVNTCTQAAWALLLSWYAGQTDVLFGITVAGRPTELDGVENSVGLFINTLPLRLRIDPTQPVGTWLQHVLRRNVELRQHEQLPLGEVQALSPLGRGQTLFDSLFVFENAPVDRSLDEWKLRWHIDEKNARTHTNYLLTIVIIPGERLTLQLTCDRERFEPAAIDRMLAHFKSLLLALVSHPDARLGDLPRLGHDEAARLAAWNATGYGNAVPADLVPLFEQQVQRRPDAVAARCGDRSVTYAELDHMASAIGSTLVDAGVRPDDVVALYDHRGIDLLAMIIGVYKAGAAYLPLDLRHPPARLAEVLHLAKCALVLQGNHPPAALADALQDMGNAAPRSLRISDVSHGRRTMRATAGGRCLAYVIYTSGSTGVPKGAMVERSGMLNNLLQKHVQLGLTEHDVIAQTASAAFDISVWQFLSGLLCGATIEIVPDELAQDPRALQRHVIERGVTVLECVPAMLRGFLTEADEHPAALPLRWLLPTGEALPPQLARDWLQRHPDVPLLNVYGPAECADDVALQAFHSPEEVRGPHLPIGRPVANLRLHVVNASMDMLPVGVAGELCIAGIGVGRGYLNDPRRTSAAFVPHPDATFPGERLYSTGDLVRQREDGVFEYLGRIDHQVKLRGHRIELGEIEARLAGQPGVAQAVALVREDRPGDQRLVAYVVPKQDAALDPEALRSALALTLPPSMVPSLVLPLAAWPLNPNGKIDRRRLPAPEWPLDDGDDARGSADPLHAALASIWADVLGLARVGLHQDFFALGGHSLLATQVVSRIRRQLGAELPLRAVFDAPTIAQLAEVLGSAAPAAATDVSPIPARHPAGDLVPLSFAQERMWFLAELDPRSALYNLPVVLQLEGELDVAALAGAFEHLQARHEVLRSVIVRAEPQALVRILPPAAFPLPVEDITATHPDDLDAAARQRAWGEAERPFDLTAAPPWRARLLRLGPHRHWLLLTLHHIAADGWAMGVLMRELAEAYRALMAKQAPAFPPQTRTYADFAAWQRTEGQSSRFARQLAYWQTQLGDRHDALELPTDRPRPPVQAHRGASLDLEVDAELMKSLRAVGQRQGATPFMVLLAAYATLLHRYSGQRDLRIGTPVAGRQRVETEGIVGLFANTLVLRCRFDDLPDFPTLLRQVRETALGAQAHQDLPFEQLVEALQPERDLSRTPVFQALFIFQNMDLAPPALEGLAVTPLPASHGTSKFDISLIAEEGEDGALRASFEYDTDLFDASTIARMAAHLVRILRHAAEATPGPVADWSLFDPAPPQAWSEARTPVSVIEAFEQEVLRRPAATALIVGDDPAASLTYGELDRRATALAHHLIARGVAPDDLLAICLPRSASLVVALLAVLKAGGAYVPLDPNYPADRLAWMLEDARPRLLLTETTLLRRLPPHAAEALCLDRRAEERGAPVSSAARPQHLAYCIYTSGSTGTPKGVQVTRHALGNLLGSMQQRLDILAGEMLLAVTSLSFDIAALELYLPLVTGGTILLAGDAQASDAGALLQLLESHPVRTMQATPATWRMLLDAGWAPGRRPPLRLLCGGEPMGAELAARLLERSDALWNVYGPTETTVWSTMQRVLPDTVLPPPIGHPIDRTEAHVLDDRLNPVPLGVAGELYLGGDGLARGYRGRPDHTAERFVPHPSRPGQRLYRTGDVVRQRPDGTLVCLGRSDRQIKLRGFRIELDEIESTLAAVDGIEQAAVVVFGDGESKEIVAYGVATAGTVPCSASVRAALARSLPAYMVPARFVWAQALPLTPNAKVDRKALTPPPVQDGLGRHAPPANAIEALVANVWEELLQQPQVGRDHNFFHLGGHSLLAVRVMQRLKTLLGRDLPLTLLFKAPTLRELAAALHADGAGTTTSPLIALQSQGSLRPLFCIHPAGGHVASYLPLVQALGPDQPVHGLQSRSLFDPHWQDTSVAEMAQHYVAALRELQPSGPYQLLGWSLGGLVAHAMAALLERDGEPVSFVGLIDTTRHRDAAVARRHDRASDLVDQLDGLSRSPLEPAVRSALQRELAALPPEDQPLHLLGWAKVHAALKDDVDVETIELQLEAHESAHRLMREHRVDTIDAPLTVWWAEHTLAAQADALADWQGTTRGGVRSTTLSADHWSVMRHPGLHAGVKAALVNLQAIVTT